MGSIPKPQFPHLFIGDHNCILLIDLLISVKSHNPSKAHSIMSTKEQVFKEFWLLSLTSLIIDSQHHSILLPEKVVVPDVLMTHSLFPGVFLESALSFSLLLVFTQYSYSDMNISLSDILWTCSPWASWMRFTIWVKMPQTKSALLTLTCPFCWGSVLGSPSPLPCPTSNQRCSHSPLGSLCLSSSCCPQPTLLYISAQSSLSTKPFHLSTSCVAF